MPGWLSAPPVGWQLRRRYVQRLPHLYAEAEISPSRAAGRRQGSRRKISPPAGLCRRPGELQLEAKDYLPAIANLEKSLALYADYCQALASGTFAANAPDASFFAAEPPNVHYRLALCHQALGDNESARREILTALSARPKTIEYLAAAEEIFGGSFLPEIVIPALEKNPAHRQFYFDFAESLGAVKLQAEINDIRIEGAAPLRQTSFQSLPQCIDAARENAELLFLTALELAAAERNEEAAAATAKLCPPADLLISTLIGGDIEPLLSSP